MMRAILLLAAVFTIAFPGFAQNQFDSTSSVRPLSLPECVDIALKNNLNVRRSIFNVQNADVSLFQSKMAFLPSLNGGLSYGLNYGRSLNPVTNSYIARNGNNINAQLSGSLLLFNGFRLQNSFRQSRKDFEASNADLEKAKNDVIINTVTNYINVIFNKELLETNKYQLNSSQQQLDRIKRQVAAGALPKSNELTQEAQVSTFEVNVINQENALNLSMLQLKQSMQIPASEPLDVVIPELELENLVLDQTPDQIFATSIKTMPEIRSAMLKVESARYALKAAKGSLYPRLTLNGSAFTNYSSFSRDQPFGTYTEAEQLKDNLAEQVGFQLSIPIFNNWNVMSNVQRAAIQTEVARLNEIQAQNTLRQTIETAYNDAYAASKTYAANLKQVSAREEAYRMVLQRFDIGAANFAEKQIAENDLFQSRSDLTRAKYNFIFRKKILDFYQGKQITY